MHVYILDSETGSLVPCSIFSQNLAASSRVDLFWNLTCKNNTVASYIILEFSLLNFEA